MITGGQCVALWGRCSFVRLCVTPAGVEACCGKFFLLVVVLIDFLLCLITSC